MPEKNKKRQERCYLERKSLKEEMLSLVTTGDWKSVLRRYDDLDMDYHEPLLVWVQPSLSLLEFLAAQVSQLGLSGILSVGCGCGFLEWLMVKATGVNVEGLEVSVCGWIKTSCYPFNGI